MKHFAKILQSKKTVFTYDDLSLLLWISNRETLKSFFVRGVKEWLLIHASQWIYTLKNLNIYELWNKMKKQSYVSFETILKKEWIIFQDYSKRIFFASDNSIIKQSQDTIFQYCKLKNSILTNPIWLINMWSYMIATKERAICDRLYLSPDYYFDYLHGLDYDLLESISQIYNKRVILSIQQLITDAQHR